MSKEKVETVQRISNVYASDDCVQVMIPHDNYGITILSNEGVEYHYLTKSSYYVNEYLKDDRRFKFPYSNIPEHYSKQGSIKQMVVNQIFDYNKPYIEIHDGQVIENYVVKYGNESLWYRKILKPLLKSTKYISWSEAEQFCNNKEKLKFNLNGGSLFELEMPKEKELLNFYKNLLLDKIREEESHHDKTPLLSKYAREYVYRLTVDDIPGNKNIYAIENCIVLNNEGKYVELNIVDIKFHSKDNYEMRTYEYPIIYYTDRQIKSLADEYLIKTKDYKISSSLNKDVSKEELKQQKRLLKTLK